MSNTSETDTLPSPEWRANLTTALRQEKATWIFVFRALLSLFLTGWLAMRFSLASPSTAMLTTVLILNRRSGMIIAKSFYRAIGTVVGGIASIALIALFSQHRELFLLSFGGWIGICAVAAGYLRNFKSYGFLLAGYTTCFITLTVYNTPLSVFDATVARGSEVMLGIIVTTIVNEVIFPERMGKSLWNLLDRQFDDLVAYMRMGFPDTLSAARVQALHTDFIRQAVQIEDLRSSAIFESTEIAARSTFIQYVNQWYMRTTTSFHSFYTLVVRMKKAGHEHSVEEAFKLYESLLKAIGQNPWGNRQAGLLYERLRVSEQEIREGAAQAMSRFVVNSDEYVAFDALVGLLLRIIDELEHYLKSLDRLHNGRSRLFHLTHPPFKRMTDIVPSIINGVRCFLAIEAMGAFWIYSNWHYGPNALLNTGMYCALFSSMPNPAKVTLQVTYGYGLACIAAFFFIFRVMPLTDSYYPVMFASYVPFVMLAFVAMAKPKYFAIGLGYAICIVFIVGFKNPPVYDVAGYLNNAIAQMIGMASAAIAFLLLPAASTLGWVAKRAHTQMHRLVGYAAVEPLEGLHERFESGSRDLFNQLLGTTSAVNSSELVNRALAINDVGQTLIEIRTIVAERPFLPDDIVKAIRATILMVSLFYRNPTRERYLSALNSTRNTDHMIRPLKDKDEELRRHFYLLYQALLDADEHMSYVIK
ncbi:p-hydroxybenzoic acid efflux pump subunit AaeB [Halomonadaceae bacterium LMG 33818]|uniref:FUSC family protein n=1 Tax=Cernens ardua TaxID=3402176 RepID=UPI003EDBAD70